ncbi:hypothetical protein ABZ931_25370, partial [Streptomyces neyagawaensis]
GGSVARLPRIRGPEGSRPRTGRGHGGGEGKTSGGRHPVSPWGQKEGRTRSPKKASNKYIVRRRKTNKKR